MKKIVLSTIGIFLLSLASCDTGDIEPSLDGGLTTEYEVSLSFKLVNSLRAYQANYVVQGKAYNMNTKLSTAPKDLACTRVDIRTETQFVCSLGSLPVDTELRFMLRVLQPDGTTIPVCKSADVDQCRASLLATVEPSVQGYIPPVTVISVPETDVPGGVAYKMVISVPW